MDAEAEEKIGKGEAFLCPFCGAPYRELIPADTVQVKCRYCGATVLVPPRLGGAVKRCPNHPETLAVGICSGCGKNYCEHCLHVYTPTNVNAQVYYCPECLQKMIEKQKAGAVIGFFFFVVYALFLFSFSGGAGVGAFMLLFGFFFLVLVFSREPVYPTVYEKRTEQEKQLEPKTSEKKQLTPEELEKIEELYQKLRELYRREGEEKTLEDKIRWRTIARESREEAIYNIARQKGLVE